MEELSLLGDGEVWGNFDYGGLYFQRKYNPLLKKRGGGTLHKILLLQYLENVISASDDINYWNDKEKCQKVRI